MPHSRRDNNDNGRKTVFARREVGSLVRAPTRCKGAANSYGEIIVAMIRPSFVSPEIKEVGDSG